MLAHNSARDYVVRPERRVEPNRRVQPSSPAKPLDSGSREKLAWMGTVLVCIAIAITLVGRYATIAQQNYHLQYLKQQATDLTATNAALQDQVARLSAPDRIIGIAKGMGMNAVVPHQLSVDKGQNGK